MRYDVVCQSTTPVSVQTHVLVWTPYGYEYPYTLLAHLPISIPKCSAIPTCKTDMVDLPSPHSLSTVGTAVNSMAVLHTNMWTTTP